MRCQSNLIEAETKASGQSGRPNFILPQAPDSILSLALAAAAAISLSCGSVVAATFNIPAGNVASLRNAILTANTNNENDVIQLATDSTYTLTMPDLTIYGSVGLPVIQPDGRHLLTITGKNSTIRRNPASSTADFRILHVRPDAFLTVSGVTIANGKAASTDSDDGSAVHSSGALTLDRCILMNNVGERGGAVYNIGSLVVTDSTLSNNSAFIGGAIYNSGVAVITGSSFEANSASPGFVGSVGGGGGIFTMGVLTMSGSSFSGNSAALGGALSHYSPFGGTPTVVSTTTFSTNQAPRFGGAIYGYGVSTIQLTRCIFVANSSPLGGGLGVDSTRLSISHCTFSGNSANDGGGIYAYRGGVDLDQSTLVANQAQNGGGIAFFQAGGTLSNSTLSNNQAFSNGGAVYAYASAQVRITGVTVHQNSAGATGGGVGALGLTTSGGFSTISLQNTLLQTGATGANLAVGGGGAIVSLGHNVSNDAASGDATTAPGGLLSAASDRRNTDPLLAPLADNGGSTSTCALLSGSPAIDAADGAAAAARDQRGYLRTNSPDIGAFESSGGLLRLVSAGRSGNDFTINFEAVEGKIYRLEQTPDLSKVAWQPTPGVPDLMATSDTIFTLTHPDGVDVPRRFYRVRVTP